jgi:hypothetical protein
MSASPERLPIVFTGRSRVDLILYDGLYYSRRPFLMGERRRESKRIRERVRLALPVRVRAMGVRGLAWEELTRLMDVSPFGARLSLSRPTEPGRLLHLTMPLPRPLRSFDHAEDQYRVWSLVRNVRAFTEGAVTRFEVGLAFVGKYPPAGHAEDPEKLYDVDLSKPGGLYEPKPKERPERSDATRLGMAVEVEVALLDGQGGVTQTGVTVTENLSRRGAAVYAPFGAERGSFVLLRSAQFGLEVLAAVRACRTDERGVTRLHLEFLDREWPLDGVE